MNKQDVYFQKQSTFSLHCGLHAVNNLLGNQTYTIDQMNQICYQLSDSFINPHKHIFGGDFDVNVLIIALQQKKLSTKWFDRQSQNKELIGYLINVYTKTNVIAQKILNISSRHWLCVRKINDKYYFLDSKNQQYTNLDKLESQKKINQMLQQYKDQRKAEVIQIYKEK